MGESLATEVEFRDDGDDWEEEGLDKPAMIQRLRDLQDLAPCTRDDLKACFHFRQTSSGEFVDLAPGVGAIVAKDGEVVSLEFDTNYPIALKLLSCAIPQDSTQ